MFSRMLPLYIVVNKHIAVHSMLASKAMPKQNICTLLAEMQRLKRGGLTALLPRGLRSIQSKQLNRTAKWQSSALKLDEVCGPFLLDFCHYRVKGCSEDTHELEVCIT